MFSKQWIHFFLSERWPPTSTILTTRRTKAGVVSHKGEQAAPSVSQRTWALLETLFGDTQWHSRRKIFLQICSHRFFSLSLRRVLFEAWKVISFVEFLFYFILLLCYCCNYASIPIINFIIIIMASWVYSVHRHCFCGTCWSFQQPEYDAHWSTLSHLKTTFCRSKGYSTIPVVGTLTLSMSCSVGLYKGAEILSMSLR